MNKLLPWNIARKKIKVQAVAWATGHTSKASFCWRSTQEIWLPKFNQWSLSSNSTSRFEEPQNESHSLPWQSHTSEPVLAYLMATWVVVFIPSNLVGRKDCFREIFREASAMQNVPYASDFVNLNLRELPRTLCFHKCDSFASAATRFASAKPCPVPSPLPVLQVSMSFRGKKLQKCFRELPRLGPEAHFSCLMSKSWLVLFKSKKTPLTCFAVANRPTCGSKTPSHAEFASTWLTQILWVMQLWSQTASKTKA